jgi:hypothetical protein
VLQEWFGTEMNTCARCGVTPYFIHGPTVTDLSVSSNAGAHFGNW